MGLIIYLLKSAAILSIFYAAYLALLKNETFFKANRQFLILGIITSILAPAINLKRRVYKEMPVMDFDIPIQAQDAIPETNVEVIGVDLWQIGFLLYLIGVFCMLFIFFRKLKSIVDFLKSSVRTRRNGYHFIQIDGLDSPFSFFNYIVLDENGHTAAELEMIILHEQAHASQRHSIDMIFAHLMLVFQWFNPLAWMYKNAIVQNLEYLADAATARQVESNRNYQLTLVKVAVPKMVPGLTHSFYQSFIKKRIVMLNKQSSSELKKYRMLLVLPILAVFIWSFNVNEVIEYKTEGKEVSPSLNFNRAFQVSYKSTNADLQSIEDYFNTETEIDLKIEVLERDAKGQILGLDLLSRFDTKLNYTKNLSIKVGEVDSNKFDATISLEEGNIVIFLKQEGGSDHKILITPTGVKSFLGEKTEVKKLTSNTESKKFQSLTESMVKNTQEVEKPFKKVITKNASKEDLELLVKELKSEYNVSLDFSKLDYSNDGLLTSIKLKVKDNKTGNQASSSYNSDKAIGDIIIYRTENGTFGVTSASNSIVQNSSSISTSTNTKTTTITNSKEFNQRREELEARKAEVESRSEEMKLRTQEMKERSQQPMEEAREREVNASQNDRGLTYYKDSVTGESKVLFFLNGEEINEKKFRMIKPEDIESINILKGESAIALYQDKMKGKEGVMLITTKVKKK